MDIINITNSYETECRAVTNSITDIEKVFEEFKHADRIDGFHVTSKT